MVDFTKSDGFVTDNQGRRQYANRDDAALIEGTEIDATDHNEVRNELVYLIGQAGITPSNDDLTQVYQAVQKMVAAGASSAAIGFTPVEQGGITGLTEDKVNIGNASGGLSAYVAGQYYGVLATQSWAAGLFATQTALTNEIQRASDAESNLQAGKYDKTGGILSGTVTVEGNTGGVVAQYNPGSPATDTYVNYPGFVSVAEGRGGEFHCQVQEHVGYKFIGLFSLRGSAGNWRYMSLPEGARINDSDYGDVAYTADLASYVPTATYVSDFSTSDSQVINLPYGKKIQSFVVSVPSNGTNSHRITYPEAFSGASVPSFNGNDNSQSRSVSLANNTTPDATGFDITVSVHGNSTAGSTDALTLTVNAIGPR
nr:hypothetical protein [uncultured Acetobacter sp.]